MSSSKLKRRWAMRAVLWSMLTLCSTGLHASVAWQGTLYNVHVMRNGMVLLYSNGSRAGQIPACGASQPQRFSFDSTTPGGKSLLASLLSADASKRTVILVGTNSCVYPDSEGLDYMYFADH